MDCFLVYHEKIGSKLFCYIYVSNERVVFFPDIEIMVHTPYGEDIIVIFALNSDGWKTSFTIPLLNNEAFLLTGFGPSIGALWLIEQIEELVPLGEGLSVHHLYARWVISDTVLPVGHTLDVEYLLRRVPSEVREDFQVLRLFLVSGCVFIISCFF